MKLRSSTTPSRKQCRKFTCPRTRRTLIDRGWYDEMEAPPIPPAVDDPGTTIQSLLAYCHYLIARDWNKPDGVKVSDIQSDTYGEAVGAGWKGSLSNWRDNIFAGIMLHGGVDAVPKKVKIKLRP